MKVASLPMYDLPELAPAHDALWSSIRRRLEDAPASLTRGVSAEALWGDPDLLFSQACGYPLTTDFAGRLRVVATPCYAAEGCEGPTYASAVVVRADDPRASLADFRGTRCAINERRSHSGMNVLRAMIAPLAGGRPFFGEVVLTGAHVASISAVRDRAADLCAVDVVTHALLARHRPAALEGTRVLALSPRAPAVPYVTRADASDDLVAALRRALEHAMADTTIADARAALLLDGVCVLGDDAYAPIVAMANEALGQGYPDLV